MHLPLSSSSYLHHIHILCAGAVVRRCSSKYLFLKICKFHRKTPGLQSLFDKDAGLKAWNFIKEIIQHRSFPVKLAKFLRTPFLQNTFGGYFYLCCFSWMLLLLLPCRTPTTSLQCCYVLRLKKHFHLCITATTSLI